MHQIVQQPDGRYAIWSSLINDFVQMDYENAEEIIQYFLTQSRLEITAGVNGVIEALRQGNRPYHDQTLTFNQCVALYRETWGPQAKYFEEKDGKDHV